MSLPVPPPDFRVVALIAVRDEEDILGASLEALHEEKIDFYILDDHSTDGSLESARSFEGRGLLGIEQLGGSGQYFSLRRIIARKEELSREIEASWFINHDADEFREGPWPGVDLRWSIYLVDRLGYTAVDFQVFDFWPTGEHYEAGTDPRGIFSSYRPNVEGNRLQIRCWKNQGGPLDLLSSAGHEAVFPVRRVFPIRFLLRHYPFRGFEHAAKKLFHTRGPRYDPEERAMGWHRQYEGIERPEDLRIPKEKLLRWNPLEARMGLWLMGRGDGREEEQKQFKTSILRERDLLGRSLDERNREVEKLSARLDEVEEQRRQLEKNSTEWQQESHRLRDSLESRSIALEEAEIRAERLAAEMEGRGRAIKDLEGRLRAMKHSLSWRITAPLRRLLHLMRGY